VLEVVPFKNGDDPTKPPHNLPALSTVKAANKLGTAHRDSYYQGYYHDQPREPASKRIGAILQAIGANKY